MSLKIWNQLKFYNWNGNSNKTIKSESFHKIKLQQRYNRQTIHNKIKISLNRNNKNSKNLNKMLKKYRNQFDNL
jgi:hypothetical protein